MLAVQTATGQLGQLDVAGNDRRFGGPRPPGQPERPGHRPFVGAGVNYTVFFEEKTTGALAGTELKLGNSWGAAARVGVDIALSEKDSLRIDARWIDINSDVKVNGIKVGKAEIDPLAYGIGYVHTF